MKLNRTDLLFKSFWKVLLCYGFGLIIFLLYRTTFLLYFAPSNLVTNFKTDIIQAFILGARYDSMVLSYVLVIPTLLLLLASLLKSIGLYNLIVRLSRLVIIFSMLVIVFLLIADLGFYSYFQDHINFLFFGVLEDDTKALITTIWKDYPLVYGLAGLAFFYSLVIYVYLSILKKINKKQLPFFNSSFIKSFLIISVSLILLVGGLRGGYSKLVLAPKYAEFSKNQFINDLSLNGVITFEKALKQRRQKSNNSDLYRSYGYKNIDQAFNDYIGMSSAGFEDSEKINLLYRTTELIESSEKPHIIILAMESFGGSWIKYNQESFNFMGKFKKHYDEDITFNNFISGDNGTIGSMLIMLTGLPTIPGRRYLSEGAYLNIPLQTSLNIPFEENNYTSNYVYGGKLGWRDLGKYFKKQGVDNTFGESHIRDSLKLEGTQGTEWGLYDEHFFNFILKRLENANTPQLFLGLSTSNHPPFRYPKEYTPGQFVIPDNLKKRINREEDLFIKRFQSFKYANDSLGDFLNKIKNSKLKDNTIVVVTGDHNFWGFINYTKMENFEKYKVPLYFYIPKNIRPANVNTSVVGSHEDIAPTLYSLVLNNTKYLSFGENLFDNQLNSIAVNPSVIANKEVYIYRNSGYRMSDNSSEESLKGLQSYQKALFSITDFFLKFSKNASKDRHGK